MMPNNPKCKYCILNSHQYCIYVQIMHCIEEKQTLHNYLK